MSWLDKINNELQIITGDGKEYKPNWMNAVKEREYNVSEFEFINVPGTLVKRKTPRGNRYNLEIYFQGDDHLDIAEDFGKSADDPRPWNLRHPYYGVILVQPIKLAQDNTQHNVSKFIIPIVETIDEVAPRITADPVSKVYDIANLALDKMGVSFGISLPTVFDIPEMKTNLTSVYEVGKKRIKLTFDANNYFNAYTSAIAKINDVVSEPLAAIREIQAMINAPFQFVDTVKNRVTMLQSQFDTLVESVVNLVTIFDRKRYEQYNGAIMVAMCQASVTDVDYQNRSQVLAVMTQIVDSFNQYIEDLDTLQSDNGGNPNHYMPDQSSVNEINRLVNFTISSLFQIAISSKQERVVYMEKDTNVILIAHRFYGLAPDDSTIQRIIDDNNIGLNELLLIKKGRPITYTA